MQKYKVNKHFFSAGKCYEPGMIVNLKPDFAQRVQKQLGRGAITPLRARNKAEVETQPKGVPKSAPLNK